MKKIVPTEPHKLIFSCFFMVLFYILLYEFVLMRRPSSSETVYEIGVITSRISYSILAACIFYCISIYLPIYLSRQSRKRKILFNVYQKALLIDTHIRNLILELGIDQDDFFDKEKFDTRLREINPDKPVAEFENWHL